MQLKSHWSHAVMEATRSATSPRDDERAPGSARRLDVSHGERMRRARHPARSMSGPRDVATSHAGDGCGSSSFDPVGSARRCAILRGVGRGALGTRPEGWRVRATPLLPTRETDAKRSSSGVAGLMHEAPSHEGAAAPSGRRVRATPRHHTRQVAFKRQTDKLLNYYQIKLI